MRSAAASASSKVSTPPRDQGATVKVVFSEVQGTAEGVAFTRDGGESRTLLAEAAAAVQQAKAQGGGVVVADSVSPAA